MRTGCAPRLFAAGLLLLLSTAASAQLAALKKTTPQQRATVLTDLMKKRLNLSGDQLQKASAINLEYANKVQPVIDGADRPLEEMREMKAINQQKEAALKNVLTPAQFQQYEAAKAEIRQKFEQRIMQGGAGSGGNAP
jgi:hypothetical protein